MICNTFPDSKCLPSFQTNQFQEIEKKYLNKNLSLEQYIVDKIR